MTITMALSTSNRHSSTADRIRIRWQDYPTAKLGALVQRELCDRDGMRVAPPERGGPRVLEVPVDGQCGSDGLRLGLKRLVRSRVDTPLEKDDRAVGDAGAMRALKLRIYNKLLDFAMPGWTKEYVDGDTPLDITAIMKLNTFELWSSAVGQDSNTLAGSTVPAHATIRWLREAIRHLATSEGRYMRIPEFALMASAFGCNIVVWEFDGAHFAPYLSPECGGLFLVAPKAGYVHLVHGTVSTSQDGTQDAAPTAAYPREGPGGSRDGVSFFEYLDSTCPLVGDIERMISGKMRVFVAELQDARATTAMLTAQTVSREKRVDRAVTSSMGSGQPRDRAAGTQLVRAEATTNQAKASAVEPSARPVALPLVGHRDLSASYAAARRDPSTAPERAMFDGSSRRPEAFVATDFGRQVQRPAAATGVMRAPLPGTPAETQKRKRGRPRREDTPPGNANTKGAIGKASRLQHEDETAGKRFWTFSLSDGLVAQLPKLCLDDLPLLQPPPKRGWSNRLGELAKIFFSRVFPPEAVRLLVQKTNENANYHKEQNERLARLSNEEIAALENTRKLPPLKRLTLGRAEWPSDGVTEVHMHGILGLVLMMAIRRLDKMSLHWDSSRQYDFPRVQQCMPRDLFFLIYCRFFQTGSPKRDEGNGDTSDNKELEQILDKAYSSSGGTGGVGVRRRARRPLGGDSNDDGGDRYRDLEKRTPRDFVYFPRRDFQVKLARAQRNAWLMFMAWRNRLDHRSVPISQADRDTVRMELAARLCVPIEAVDKVAVEAELRGRYKATEEYLRRVRRIRFEEDLSAHLMSLCNEGSGPVPRSSSSPVQEEVAVPAGCVGITISPLDVRVAPPAVHGRGLERSDRKLEAIETRRRCQNPGCVPKSPMSKGTLSATTFLACRCQRCGEAGVPMCPPCFSVDRHHDAAADAVNKRRTKAGGLCSRKKLRWATSV